MGSRKHIMKKSSKKYAISAKLSFRSLNLPTKELMVVNRKKKVFTSSPYNQPIKIIKDIQI